MTDAPAPTTEAGRQLIRDAQDTGTVDVGWVRAAILAIEAEARSTPAEGLDVERTIAQAIRDNWGDSPEPIWTPEEMAAFIAARLSSVQEPTDD